MINYIKFSGGYEYFKVFHLLQVTYLLTNEFKTDLLGYISMLNCLLFDYNFYNFFFLDSVQISYYKNILLQKYPVTNISHNTFEKSSLEVKD